MKGPVTPPPPIRTVDPDGQVHYHHFKVDAEVDPTDLERLRPRAWPILAGAALIAASILCLGLSTDWFAWPNVPRVIPPQFVWDDKPAVVVPAPTVADVDTAWLNCPPENFHTEDGAFHFSTLKSPTSVVGTEKFIVWGLTGRAECVTLGSDSERTGAIPQGKVCVADEKLDDGSTRRVVKDDQRVVYTCLDRAGQPIARDTVSQDLRTKRHDVPGHPGIESKCVVGITDHGCQPKNHVAQR